ncbi:hypothetical protein B0H15DRAFT_1026495 [Mycena belliarum]|uniref:Uncharacterized protein n=1 Tax=Mycena belliarum TaxID=1033014 RepID=A0AAD6TRD3_9AGAR|nr:hypothetical protein B0H15DRAFT_1026495 [Mycena belliae]
MPHPQTASLFRCTSFVKDEENDAESAGPGTSLPEDWAITQASSNFDLLRSPASLAPRPVSSASMEPCGMPSDWWHHNTNIRIVGGTGEIWSGDRIPFFPAHGSCTFGVSMKLARLASGISHGHTPIGSFIHPLLFNIPHPMLSISFPGYQESLYHQGRPRPLSITRPLKFYPTVTLAQLAKEVADYFYEFSKFYGGYCNTNDPQAILLGPGGVEFNRLRMVKLWTSNGGISWKLEVAIVDDYMQMF